MKTLTISSNLRNIFIVSIVVGIASFALAFLDNPAKAWHGYLLGYYFVTSIALGGLFFVAIQHITSAGWSATVRRIPEAFQAWVPFAILLIIPFVLRGMGIYEWTHTDEVAHDKLLLLKSPYLNKSFFIIRAVIFFVVWGLLGGKIIANSLEQDTKGGTDLTQSNVKLSAIWIPLFALSFSAFSVDLIMSLDPHWFSTMFGVNCFANMFLSAIAAIIIFVVWMKRAGYFGETVNENHIQNLGLFLFAFTVFYAYIAFCQYMLIWYANLPEETSYYLRRMENGWWVVGLLVLVFKFFVPFLLLLPREAKRNMNYLVKMAYLVLVACFVDAFWMIMPAHSEAPYIPFLEFGITIGFVGAFGFAVSFYLGKIPVQTQMDPRVHEALALHQ